MGRVEVKPGPLLAILGLLLLYLLMIARGGGDQTAADKRENAQKQARTVKNPHSYSYTLNPGSSVCGDGRVDLLVLVASALKHGDRRSAVRKTWGAPNQVFSHPPPMHVHCTAYNICVHAPIHLSGEHYVRSLLDSLLYIPKPMYLLHHTCTSYVVPMSPVLAQIENDKIFVLSGSESLVPSWWTEGGEGRHAS